MPIRNTRDVKLRKVSARLYEQNSEGTSKPLKWAKAYERLYLDLYDLKAIDGFSIDVAGVGFADEDRSEILRWISAQGRAANSRWLCLIDPQEEEQSSFKKMKIIINSTIGTSDSSYQDGKNIDRLSGSLLHQCDDMLMYEDCRDPHMLLEVRAPDELFAPLWDRLVRGQAFRKATLDVFVDVFQSEIERGLAEPYHTQQYFVERGSSNRAFITSFRFESNPIIISGRDGLDDCSVNDKTDGEKEGFEASSTREIEVQNAALITIERVFRGVSTSLKVIAVILAIGVVALLV